MKLDMKDFWDNSQYAEQHYISEPPTDEMITKIEIDLGYKLPKSYILFMQHQNGGIPKNTCFPTTEPTCWAENHIAISGIFGIGYEKSCSLGGEFGSEFWVEMWDYPNIGIAIADCPSAGHDMIFLDYRECGPTGEPCVVHVDQEDDFKITWLADDFESFIVGLVHDDVFSNHEEEKTATFHMVNTAAFSTELMNLLSKQSDIRDLETKLRKLCKGIVEEKGYFALHSDRKSLLLYDLQFWLYSSYYDEITAERFLDTYPKFIAMPSEEEVVSSGGYAPDFVRDWLKQRMEEGAIVEVGYYIQFTEREKNRLIEKFNEM
ncbi:hypothetical protein J2S19_000334 [Metabacillus malikii]|uniref:Knr4/Smi1-like domain-containing protein n=1 Tax=Metabacillus malikii TaxID=1504265 RepID=A0ABT9ZAX0_9BACI|nr:hypothetical protein [Metabacillus malikii]